MKRTQLRALAKTCTWRMVASIDTFLLGWLITGDPAIGWAIAGLEVLTKMIIYYAHERVWNRMSPNAPARGQGGGL